MVSSQNPTPEVAAGVLVSERGFISEQAIDKPLDRLASHAIATAYWGSVIAGTLLTLSLFVLSYLLMLGCRVGVASNGVLALGWGSAIWLVVTACVAYYFGGMLSNCISRPIYNGLVKGAAVWGLSIPLAMLIGGVVAAGGGLLGGGLIPLTSSAIAPAMHPLVNVGAMWTGFITLGAGLLFSILGSQSMAHGEASWLEDNCK